MNAHSALNSYRSIGNQSGVEDASPHQLVAMLFNGALERIAAAKGHMERGEVSQKGEKISRVIDIIDNLRASLNHDAGGELSANLSSLYDYMEQRLLDANLNNKPELLEEVAGLFREIKSGWDDIPVEQRGG